MTDERITHYDFKGIGFSKIGYFKEVRDRIKETERLNIELAQRHNKLEAILNSMTEGLTILDNTFTIVFANNSQKHMFPESSLIGKKCYHAFFHRDGICKNCHALKTLQTSQTFHGEVMIREGELMGSYFEWTTSPIIDHFGNINEIIVLMKDITERKAYEFKLMEADRMAAIGFLAAGIAHEINNPLTSIAGFSEGLLKRLNHIDSSNNLSKLNVFQEYLEIINEEAYRCKNIIKNMLDFSRKSTEHYEVIPIENVIDDSLSLIRQHAKDNRIKINFKNNLSSGLNQIMGNEPQLIHVFLSLFRQAFSTMENGGELHIMARNEGNEIRVSLSHPVIDRSAQSSEKSESVPDFRITQKTFHMSICFNILKNHKGELQLNHSKGGIFESVLRFPVVLP